MSVDFLNVTLRSGSPQAHAREVAQLVGASSVSRGGGIHGYSHSLDVDGFAVVGFGGSAQRGTVFVSISGAGCQRVARFDRFRDYCLAHEPKITRLDIAGDDFRGRGVSVSGALQAWREGGFNLTAWGTKPTARLVDDLGSGAGCTLYVGSSKSGKLIRVYEKGRQMGDVGSPWCRAEVQFGDKDRVIPWDAVVDPAPYFSGAYPYLRQFALQQIKLRTFKASEKVTIAVLLEWARRCAGKTINAALQHFGGDIGAVVDALRRDGVPARLQRFSGKGG